jgi:ATP-binding cassette subfamily C protein CydC
MNALRPYLVFFRSYWLLLSIGLLLTVFTLLAALGLLSLSGWFLSATAVAGLTALGRDNFNYMPPAGAVRFFAIVRTASRWGDRVVSHDATFRVLALLRLEFWKKLAPLSLHQLQGFRQGELLNRLVSDIDALDNLYLRLITPVIAAFLIILSLFGLTYWIDPTLSLILSGTLLVMAICLPLIFYGIGKRPGQSLIVQQGRLREQCTRYVDYQADLLMVGADSSAIDAILAEEHKLFAAQKAMTSISGLASAVMMMMLGLLLSGILWLAAAGVGGAPLADPMTALMAFFVLAAFESLQPLAGAFQYLSATITAATRLNQIMTTAPTIQFGSHSQSAQSGDIQLTHLQFAYPDGAVILQDISLQVAAGEHVAILGATGCGKSSLLNLLTREWEPQQGQILVSGNPIADYTEAALRQSMSVVSQQVHVFSATLADNLRLAKPDATEAELLDILQQVQLDKLLGENAAEALTVWLGDGGRQLSGGEQRRLGVARALLHDAPILLLDEATEGLDPETEADILHLIFTKAAAKTILMITHRLTGMSQMDRIALMEDGRFRLQGSHTDLLATDAYYRQIHVLPSLDELPID